MPLAITTALITSYRQRLGTDGDGRARVSPDSLVMRLAAEVSEPSTERIATLQQIDIRATLIASVPTRALDAQAITAKPGDILAMESVRISVAPGPHEVTRVRQLDMGRTTELTLAPMDAVIEEEA